MVHGGATASMFDALLGHTNVLNGSGRSVTARLEAPECYFYSNSRPNPNPNPNHINPNPNPDLINLNPWASLQGPLRKTHTTSRDRHRHLPTF